MRFALTGAAGYVAPRHMKAILETGNDLVAALDPHDSVGILDKFFPECKFFIEYERFDRYLEKLRRHGRGVDYISVCSPNYLHDAHCRLAMRVGADVICEKPVVSNPWNLDQLKEIEKETGKKVYVVLQLRYHPELIRIKESLENKMYLVDIYYVTPRGPWYHTSWKGDIEKSGGLATNIGIHLFDLVIWYFGKVQAYEVEINQPDKVSGILQLERANVKFFLSTNRSDLIGDESAHRAIIIDNEPLRFDDIFDDLHVSVYRDVLSGGGLGIEDARPSIELVHRIRSM